jgi:hypothetical protein
MQPVDAVTKEHLQQFADIFTYQTKFAVEAANETLQEMKTYE